MPYNPCIHEPECHEKKEMNDLNELVCHCRHIESDHRRGCQLYSLLTYCGDGKKWPNRPSCYCCCTCTKCESKFRWGKSIKDTNTTEINNLKKIRTVCKRHPWIVTEESWWFKDTPFLTCTCGLNI